MIDLQEYINTHDIKKLHVGCGSNILKDWLNTDIHLFYPDVSCYLDVQRPIPVPDNTFDYIHNEHMLEHFHFIDGLIILKEFYRVLKPGGKIRITLPNLDMLIDVFQNKESNRDYIITLLKPWFDLLLNDVSGRAFSNEQINQLINIDTVPTHFLNLYTRMDGHLFIYNKDTITTSMKFVGFENITRHNICESNDTNLQNLEHINRWINYCGTIGRAQLQKESMTFEGTKLYGN
jgi:SAM-dependent methyltransferase